MGYKDHADDKKPRGGRGATNNTRRLDGLGNGRAPRAERQWGDVNPAWITAYVILLTNAGGAVRFGRSRDGAVLSLGIYLDNDSTTLWLDGSDPLEDQLQNYYEQLKIHIGE